MMKDPCRRFAFGFTLDGFMARLYFFSRALVLRSKPFNINEASVRKLYDNIPG
jgi:hypothetical protein